MRIFRNLPFHPIWPHTRGGRFVVSLVVAALAALLLVMWSPAQADDSQAPLAESPYFFVESSEPGTDRLPLKSTRVNVHIAGVIADVTVAQIYRNEGQRPIHARYVFPGSTHAAVHGLNMRLGERLITARIREKAQARIEFDQASKEGKTSTLLEQHRPNVFQMQVANILPGDEVAVELRYTELLTPRDAVYGFVFPTVVGPRYNSPQGAAAHEKWIATPILAPSASANPADVPGFDLRVTLATPMALQHVRSSSHDIEVAGLGTRRAEVSLRPGPAAGQGSTDRRADNRADNRDFLLDFRLAGNHIETGLMLFRGETENFFLAMVEPPQAVAPREVNPRDFIFVVDISGSMHGFPLDTAKVLMQDLLGGLRPSDTFNVMLFSGSSRMLSPQSVPATRANIERAIATLRETGGGGSTEIVPALKRIAALPRQDGVSRSVIVVTDGYVSVESEVFQLIARHLNRHNVFAFGIGSSVNRHLIEGMARAGQGEAFIVTRPELAAEQAARFRRVVEAPVLTQVKARFEGINVSDVEPAQLPDVIAGRPVLLFGKWRPIDGQAAVGTQATLVIEGRDAGGAFRSETPAREDQASSALRHLWARQRIATRGDQEALEGGQAQKPAITELGLRYGLLTAYTSFIAVDQIVRNANPARTPEVDQPLPLPEGVSPLAMGGALGAQVPSTPEPATWAALAVALPLLALALRRRLAPARRATPKAGTAGQDSQVQQ